MADAAMLSDPEATLQPFAAGDIFLGCTLLDDPDDDHAGRGRILQYDRNLKLKGLLWTQGTRHLVGGLEFDGAGRLWAFDDHTVIHVDPASGRQLPTTEFLPRVFRSASFSADGSVYLGEHLCADQPPPGIEKMTTIQFPRIPETGALGYGNIYKFDANWQLERIYQVDNAPEFTGFKGVTHSTLHPCETFITYTTETGKRIMRYDLAEDRQLPDLVTYPGDDMRDGVWAIAVKYLRDGQLIVTRGKSFDILDEHGQAVVAHALPEYGWSDITACSDQQHALFSNVFTGTAVKVELTSGKIVGSIQTDMQVPKRSLAGIAEYPG